MFADEARFGRMNRPRPCWAPTGVRPEVAAQLVREYVYRYGAVCPKDGRCVYLIMPASDTACFQIYLDVLSRKYRRQQILLVLDGAPNHQCGLLAVPDNITLLFLPPYSPQLNERMLVQGFHYPFPALAHIEKIGSGYRETPMPWSPCDLIHIGPGCMAHVAMHR